MTRTVTPSGIVEVELANFFVPVREGGEDKRRKQARKEGRKELRKKGRKKGGNKKKYIVSLVIHPFPGRMSCRGMSASLSSKVADSPF